MLRRIEKYTRQSQTHAPLPSKEDMLAARRQRLIERMQVWLGRGRYKNELEMVNQLAAKGHDPLEIAAAALRIVRENEKQAAIEHIGAVRAQTARRDRQPSRRKRDKGRGAKRARTNWSSKRSHEAGMVRLSLDKGRSHGLRPGDVVGTLAHHADIPGKVIGAIHIQDHSTLVDVPEQFVDQVLSKNGNYRLRSKEVIVVKRA